MNPPSSDRAGPPTLAAATSDTKEADHQRPNAYHYAYVYQASDENHHQSQSQIVCASDFASVFPLHTMLMARLVDYAVTYTPIYVPKSTHHAKK